MLPHKEINRIITFMDTMEVKTTIGRVTFSMYCCFYFCTIPSNVSVEFSWVTDSGRRSNAKNKIEGEVLDVPLIFYSGF